MALSRRQKITIISLLIYWPALFALAHVPIPQLVRQAGVSDKCLHFLAYLVLVFLLWFAVSSDKKVAWGRATVWWILLVTVCYGVVDELLQYYMGRSCDAMDFLANLAGTLTGLILFSILSFWPAALVVAGIVIFGITNIARANLAALLPITNATFHLLAYAIFTALWVQYMHRFLLIRSPSIKWLILALAGPTGLLLTVRLFSIVLGRALAATDIIISVGGIAAVVTATYLTGLSRKTRNAKYSAHA